VLVCRWGEVSGVGSSQTILALEVKLGDFQILQSHVRGLMAEQLHDGGKVDAGTQHLGSICVSKLVGDDPGGNSGRGNHITQYGTEAADQRIAAARTGQ